MRTQKKKKKGRVGWHVWVHMLSFAFFVEADSCSLVHVG